ncbi:LytR/AlgR family response regulator transcription factor [Prevotella falsenii]|uniref:LytR/AlgR family response regulator transcription factor n=1 Tax=Prevotella falsenii TaxID=515414 RepID=UPI000683D840|nr:LytTR family DNA-binding domain-containing protein [Prevotella falsenii]
MKPIEEEELHQTLDRILKLRGNSHQDKPSDMQGVKELVGQMRAGNYQYRERFLIPYKDGFEIVNVNDVSFICTEHKDTRVYLRSGKFYSLSMSLDELERQLNPRRFFRANRQYIVHIDSVDGVKIYFAGKLRILLRGYENIDVMCSRERAPLLKEWLNK